MQIDEGISFSYVCSRCAERSGTCCRLGGVDKGADCFPLSEPELERISAAVAAAGKSPAPEDLLLLEAARNAVDAFSGRSGLYALEPNSKGFMAAMRNLFPKDRQKLEALFPAEQTHARLALAPDGSCVFLSPAGCLLPQEARPRFCRLFPFWVVNGRLQCFADEECLAVKENSSFTRLLHVFGTSRDEVMELYQNLRRDWGV